MTTSFYEEEKNLSNLRKSISEAQLLSELGETRDYGFRKAMPFYAAAKAQTQKTYEQKANLDDRNAPLLTVANNSFYIERDEHRVLVEAFGRFYNELVASQKQMDEDIAEAIYSDLWNLY